MLFYGENPKGSGNTKPNLLELINEFSKRAGCTVNTQKTLLLLYTNNQQSKKEIMNFIYNRIENTQELTEEMKDFYNENYKTLLKDYHNILNQMYFKKTL